MSVALEADAIGQSSKSQYDSEFEMDFLLPESDLIEDPQAACWITCLVTCVGTGVF